MKKRLLLLPLLLLLLPAIRAQNPAEERVLRGVQEMMRESGGQVTFSDLHNDPRFGAQEKAFLGRLYEIFFQIPAMLKQQFEHGARIPSRRDLAEGSGLSVASVELLLRVMESDPRMPALFDRDPSTREISSLNMDAIDAFLEARGDNVRMTSWEGETVPSFQLTSFSGRKISDQDLRGSNALLYFWFTGCPPCMRIAPILSRLERKYRSSGFRVIGVNADRVLEIEVSEAARKAYLKKNETRYPNLQLDAPTRKAFGSVNVYPMLFFLNPEGRIVHHLINYQDRATLEKVFQEMIEASR